MKGSANSGQWPSLFTDSTRRIVTTRCLRKKQAKQKPWDDAHITKISKWNFMRIVHFYRKRKSVFETNR